MNRHFQATGRFGAHGLEEEIFGVGICNGGLGPYDVFCSFKVFEPGRCETDKPNESKASSPQPAGKTETHMYSRLASQSLDLRFPRHETSNSRRLVPLHVPSSRPLNFTLDYIISKPFSVDPHHL